MRKSAVWMFVVMGCGVMMAGGCAKQEMVKKEEPVAAATVPPAPTPKTEPAQPVSQPAVAQAPEKETTKAASAETLKTALESIYFDFDSSSLSPAARATLTKNAALLRKDAFKVKIAGNCDERGSDEYNLALGERRANAARQYLVTLGIPADRLSTISYGKEKPAVASHDEAAWAKNRRDDFLTVSP